MKASNLLLRASKAQRWTVCSGSALPLPDGESLPAYSDYAIRGQVIHLIAGALLHEKLSREFPNATILCGIESGHIPKAGERFASDDRPSDPIYVKQSMVDVAETYVRDVHNFLAGQDAVSVEAITIDYQFKISLLSANEQQGVLISVDLSLTPDFMVFMKSQERYIIACVDLKTGARPVGAKLNPQLITYLAYGADIARQAIGVDQLNNASTESCVAIWQGGTLDWWQPSQEQLDGWRNDFILNAAYKIATGDSELAPSQTLCLQCTHRYCCKASMFRPNR